MKKFLSIFCALTVLLSINAAPQFKSVKTASPRIQKALKGEVVKKSAKELKARTAKFELAKREVNGAIKAPKAKKEASLTIAVDGITASGATITVTPVDAAEDQLFYWSVATAAEIAGASDVDIVKNVIVAELEETIEYYAAFGYEVTLADLLLDEEDAWTYTTLSASTDYVAVAAFLDEDGNLQGNLFRQAFTTADIPAPTGEVVDLGELECTYVDDYRDYDGSYVLYFGDADETVEIAINIFDDDFAGEFTVEDLDLDYSYYATEEGQLLLQDATVSAVLSEDGKTSLFTVSVIAYNGIQYDFTAVVTLPTDEEEEGGEGEGEGQEAVDPTGGTFEITVTDITASGAAITVTPSIAGATFYWSVAPTTAIVGLSDEDLVKNFLIAELEEGVEYYAQYGYELTIADLLLDEEDSWTYTTLSANTEYVVLAAYLDAEGNLQESVVKQSFTTLEAQLIDLTFIISQNENGITITPSDNENAWDYMIVSKSVFDTYGADIIASSIYGQYGTDYAVTGEKTLTWDGEDITYYCTADGTYVIVVWGAGETSVNTIVVSFEFEFTAEEESEEGIENIELTKEVKKVVIDGNLFIVRDGKIFNANGTQVR